MFNRYLIGAALALALPGAALAGAEAVNVEKGSFFEQRAAINEAFAEDRLYSEISDADRRAVIQALDKMEAVLGERSIDELNQAEKVELFNAQEIVNTKLTQASEDSRIVCRRERVTGSHMRTNVCSTVAERRKMRERGTQVVRDAQVKTSLPELKTR